MVMKYRYIVAVIVVGLVSVCCHDAAYAQNNRRVEVTTTYIPEMEPVTKLMAPTVIEDDTPIVPDISYNIVPDTWQFDLESHTFKPATATYWDFNRSKQFYAKLGGGYPMLTNGIVRYATQNARVGYFGVGIDHLGDFAQRSNELGMERFMKHSYSMQNNVDIYGGVFAGRRMFDAGVSYDYNIFNRYAELSPEVARLHFHDVGLNLCFGDNFANLSRLNFAVELHGNYWAHQLPGSTNDEELGYAQLYSAGGSLHLARNLRQNRVDIKAGYDMWSQFEGGNYRDTRFWLGVDFSRRFHIFELEAGLKYMYDKVAMRDKASHFVMPRVRLLVDLQKAAFAPYIELNTTVAQNGVSSLFKQNPYIDYVTMRESIDAMPNTRSYDLALGFTGTAWKSRFAYRAYVGANFMRDQLFWYVANTGLFGVDAGDNNRIFFGVELSLQPVSGLSIDASFRAHADNTSATPYQIAESKMVADMNIEYTHRRWKVYASADVIGRKEWSQQVDSEGNAPVIFSMPTKVDLGVGVSFRATNSVEIYVNGRNLLDSKIFDFAYYYRAGIGFDAGVKLNF